MDRESKKAYVATLKAEDPGIHSLSSDEIHLENTLL